jgi:non-ribosomal peptide synthetase component F
LAAFKAVLHRCTGQNDILVGTYIVNRTQPELEDVLGLKTNQLALRTQMSGDPTFRELLRRVRQTALEAYSHQDIPFVKLMEALQASGHTPLSIEAIVQFVRVPEKQLLLPELSAEFRIPQPAKTKPWGFSLSLAQPGDETIKGGVSFDIDRYDPARVRRMMAAYVTLLEQVTARPELRLSDLQVSLKQ